MLWDAASCSASLLPAVLQPSASAPSSARPKASGCSLSAVTLKGEPAAPINSQTQYFSREQRFKIREKGGKSQLEGVLLTATASRYCVASSCSRLHPAIKVNLFK